MWVWREKKIYLPEPIKDLVSYNIITIKCGAFHSYAKSDDNAHFLFGSNEYNECSLKRTGEDLVFRPCFINDRFSYLTDGKIITSVHLGDQNTFIIAKSNKIKYCVL